MNPVYGMPTAVDYSFRSSQRPFLHRRPRYDPGFGAPIEHLQYSASSSSRPLYLKDTECYNQRSPSFPMPLYENVYSLEGSYACIDRSPLPCADQTYTGMPFRPRPRNARLEKSGAPRRPYQRRNNGRRHRLSGVIDTEHPREPVTGDFLYGSIPRNNYYPRYHHLADEPLRSHTSGRRQRKPHGLDGAQYRTREVDTCSDDTSSSTSTSSWPSFGGDKIRNAVYYGKACHRRSRNDSLPTRVPYLSKEYCTRAETERERPGLGGTRFSEPLDFTCRKGLPYQTLRGYQNFTGYPIPPKPTRPTASDSMTGGELPQRDSVIRSPPTSPPEQSYKAPHEAHHYMADVDSSTHRYDNYQPEFVDYLAQAHERMEPTQSWPDVCFWHTPERRNPPQQPPNSDDASLREERQRLVIKRKILEAEQAKLRRDLKILRWKIQRLQMRQSHARPNVTILTPDSSSPSLDEYFQHPLRSDASSPGYEAPVHGDTVSPALTARSKAQLDHYNQSWEAASPKNSILSWPTADLSPTKLNARDHTTQDPKDWDTPRVMAWNAFKFFVQAFGIKPRVEISESTGPTWSIAGASPEQLMALKRQARHDMLRWSPDKMAHRYPGSSTDERAKAVYEAVQLIYKECKGGWRGLEE